MKKLWKWIVGLFTFVVGILVLSGKKNKKVKEIKHKIRNNEKKVKAIDTKINSVKEEEKIWKEEIDKEKVFDKSVANALANSEIDTTNVKLTNKTM